jgi:hypothetical protein
MYAYCRDKVVKYFPIYFYSWLSYAFVSSLAIILVPFTAYKYAIMPNGRSEGVYAAGFASFTTLIAVHHCHMGIEYRNWTVLMVALFALSLLFYMPVGICRNEF